MSPMPRITGSDLVAALMKSGFVVKRIKGSHQLMAHQDGRRTVVPVHAGEIIGPGPLHKILRACEMNVEELRTILRNELPYKRAWTPRAAAR